MLDAYKNFKEVPYRIKTWLILIPLIVLNIFVVVYSIFSLHMSHMVSSMIERYVCQWSLLVVNVIVLRVSLGLSKENYNNWLKEREN